jgi:hypothetical protein
MSESELYFLGGFCSSSSPDKPFVRFLFIESAFSKRKTMRKVSEISSASCSMAEQSVEKFSQFGKNNLRKSLKVETEAKAKLRILLILI